MFDIFKYLYDTVKIIIEVVPFNATYPLSYSK